MNRTFLLLNMRDKFFGVITTIQPPTKAMRLLGNCAKEEGFQMLVVGDKKGPHTYNLPNTKFFSLDDQLNAPFSLAQKLPTGHYARKNLGYLQAISQGAICIYETDDDNAPLPS